MTVETKWRRESWEVRVWDGDQWPERRVSLAAKGERGRAIAISPQYVTRDQALSDLSRAAACVNALQGIANPAAVAKLVEAAHAVAEQGYMTGSQRDELLAALAALGQEK